MAGEPRDPIAAMASGLSESRAHIFLDAIDRSLPGYSTLETYIIHLTQSFECLSSIDIESETNGSFVLDWSLEIRSKSETGRSERRRGKVTCRVEKKGRNWKVVALDPITFFSPPV